MRKYLSAQKRILMAVGTIVLLLVLPMLLCSKSFAKGNQYRAKDFDYEVEVEECDEERLVLSVEIENNGTDFEGVFRIVFKEMGYRFNIVYYDTEITLPDGGDKSFEVEIPITAQWPNDTESLVYELVSDSGEVVSLGEDKKLLTYVTSPRNNGGSSYLSDKKNLLENFYSDLHPMHAWIVIVLVVIFVVIAGPVGYIILAKKNKREWYWGFVPAVSFIFVILILIAGGTSRASGVNLSSIRVIDGAGKKDDFVNFIVYNASAGKWELTFDDTVNAVGGANEYYSYEFDTKKGNLAVVNDGRIIRMKGNSTAAFSPFYGCALADASGSKNCFVLEDIDVNHRGGVEATIRNKTGKKISMLFVATGNSLYCYTDIPSKEKFDLDECKEYKNTRYSYDYYFDQNNSTRLTYYRMEDIKNGIPYYIADYYASDNSFTENMVFAIVENGEKITSGKAKEISYSVYYAAE